MPILEGLRYLRLARNEFLAAQDSDPEEWTGKLEVLTTETDHVLELGRRYIQEMKKESKVA